MDEISDLICIARNYLADLLYCDWKKETLAINDKKMCHLTIKIKFNHITDFKHTKN